jgi:hypothetical protein
VLSTAEPSQYLCVVEHAAGLHYDKQTNEWGPHPFTTGDMAAKYVLRKLTDDDRDHQKGKWWSLIEDNPNANWAFFEFGKEAPIPLETCSDNVEGIPMFICKPVVTEGSFNKYSRRFEIIVHGGYISQGIWEQYRRENSETYEYNRKNKRALDPSNPDDLFIAIGKCSPS